MCSSDVLELQAFVSVCELHKKRERKGKVGEESLKDSKSTYLLRATQKDAQPTSPLKCWKNSLKSLRRNVSMKWERKGFLKDQNQTNNKQTKPTKQRPPKAEMGSLNCSTEGCL